MTTSQAVMRSFLFAPGGRPDMYGKTLTTGADIVCIDLEDATAPADKAGARETGFAFLSEGHGAGGPIRAVRMNGLKTVDGAKDLVRLAELAPKSGLLVIPKVDAAEEVRVIAAQLDETGSGLRLIPLIETLRALEDCVAIAKSSPRVAGLIFGAVDFSAELGVQVAHEPLLYARSRLVVAARMAEIELFDVPTLDFRDLDLVRRECETARALGFTGKAVMHPSHVGIVNHAFTPTPAELARALKVVAAFEASPTGLVVVDGKLIEKPVIRSMQAIIARATAAGVTAG